MDDSLRTIHRFNGRKRQNQLGHDSNVLLGTAFRFESFRYQPCLERIASFPLPRCKQRNEQPGLLPTGVSPVHRVARWIALVRERDAERNADIEACGPREGVDVSVVGVDASGVDRTSDGRRVQPYRRSNGPRRSSPDRDPVPEPNPIGTSARRSRSAIEIRSRGRIDLRVPGVGRFAEPGESPSPVSR